MSYQLNVKFLHLWQKLLQEDDFYRIRLPSNILSPPGRDYIISSVKAVSMNHVLVNLKFLDCCLTCLVFSTGNFSFHGFITDLFFEFGLSYSICLTPFGVVFHHNIMILGANIAWSFHYHYHMIDIVLIFFQFSLFLFTRLF